MTHGAGPREALKLELAVMTEQCAFQKERAHKAELKLVSVRKSRDDMMRINADLREEVELLRAMLDNEGMEN